MRSDTRAKILDLSSDFEIWDMILKLRYDSEIWLYTWDLELKSEISGLILRSKIMEGGIVI